MIAAHQTMLAPPALPYDAEVEYLESTGTQYVDTGIVPTTTTGVEVDVLFTIPSSGYINTIIGGGNGWKNNELIIVENPSSGGSLGRIYYNLRNVDANMYTENANALAGSRHVMKLVGDGSRYSAWLDGSLVGSDVAQVSTSRTMFLLAANRGTAGDPLVGKLYAAKIWQSSVLVRDFQPVRVGSGSSAVGYLYDRVSGELFGNAGTGAFTIGPDK